MSLPLLVLVLVGTIDFARVFYTAIELTNAARAGAQYGAANLATSSDISGMRTVAANAINLTGFDIVASRTCECADDLGAPFDTDPIPNSCTTPVVLSCHGIHRVVFVTVTVSTNPMRPFRTLTSLVGIPSSVPLSSRATLRVSE